LGAESAESPHRTRRWCVAYGIRTAKLTLDRGRVARPFENANTAAVPIRSRPSDTRGSFAVDVTRSSRPRTCWVSCARHGHPRTIADLFRFGHATSAPGRRPAGRRQRPRRDGPTEPETVQGPVDDTGRVHVVLDGQRRPLDTVQHHIEHHGQVLRRVQLRHRHHVHNLHDRVRAARHTGVVGARPTGEHTFS